MHSRLLRHKDAATTMVYTNVLNRFAAFTPLKSPLDP
jgi:hypothetical protein